MVWVEKVVDIVTGEGYTCMGYIYVSGCKRGAAPKQVRFSDFKLAQIEKLGTVARHSM